MIAYRRIVLTLLLAAGLAPGLVVRAPTPGPDLLKPVTVTPVTLPRDRDAPAGLSLEAAWLLRSPTRLFGGYSGLINLDGRGLVAVSDGGRLLPIRIENGAVAEARIDRFERRGGPEAKLEFDLEAITRDPATGEVWIAAEQANSIQRYTSDFVASAKAYPPAMRQWTGNAGPETLARLSDGRFLVLQEASLKPFGRAHAALLYPSDPTRSGPQGYPRPVRFTIELPDMFRPVDAAALPDGRVAILLRRLEFPFPPGFASAIAIADPRTIRAGEVWATDTLIRFGDGWPKDNYEGLAIEALLDGSVRMWVIADDNNMERLQKTLLLRLRYRPQDT